MSQMVTRKGPVGEDKEKGQVTDTPVKEMKKKMAANAEKEKQAAEKHVEKEKEKEKTSEKQSEKAEKSVDKNSERKERSEKSHDKKEKSEKSSEKKDKPAEKEKAEKIVDKKSETAAEKPKEDKNAKPEKTDGEREKEKEKDKKRTDTPKPKQNGARTNGLPTAATGASPSAAQQQQQQPSANGEHSDATVSSDDELVIIDHERDDMFPELAYEDSDGEFEPPTPEGLPSRSYTRRSQAKVARTPETPRPASDKRAEREAPDDSKESKILKLKDEAPSTDRKLRSSDSPKPESKKPEKSQEKKVAEKEAEKETDATKAAEKPSLKDLEVIELKDDDDSKDKSTVEMVVEIDIEEGAARKEGTNYSRSRVKVSPYRRAVDQTTSSIAANYTGNNTTMEMDITENSSFIEETPPMDSPYLSGLRSIRGRKSYKPLKEMALRNISVNRSARSSTSVTVAENPSRPTAPVVGRKRKPEGEDPVELEIEAEEQEARGKRARLLETLTRPFHTAASTPLPPRRNAEIVGINTDLPLTAPVATPDTFDPETLKAAGPVTPPPPVALAPGPVRDRDSKRCAVM